MNGEAYRCRVSQRKVPHLFDVNTVVEEDQVSSLLLLAVSRRGRGLAGGVGGGGRGAARLGGGQGAAGANGDGTDVSTCWGGRGNNSFIAVHGVHVSVVMGVALFTPGSWLPSAGEPCLWASLLPE